MQKADKCAPHEEVVAREFNQRGGMQQFFGLPCFLVPGRFPAIPRPAFRGGNHIDPVSQSVVSSWGSQVGVPSAVPITGCSTCATSAEVTGPRITGRGAECEKYCARRNSILSRYACAAFGFARYRCARVRIPASFPTGSDCNSLRSCEVSAAASALSSHACTWSSTSVSALSTGDSRWRQGSTGRPNFEIIAA